MSGIVFASVSIDSVVDAMLRMISCIKMYMERSKESNRDNAPVMYSRASRKPARRSSDWSYHSVWV